MKQSFLVGFVGLSIATPAAANPLSHAQYQRHFEAAQSRFVDAGAVMFPKPYPTSVAGKMKRFTAAERLLRESIADLTVTPPADAKADNAAMLADFRMIDAEYRHAITDLAAGRMAAVKAVSAAAARSPLSAMYGRAVKDLEAKGYKFHYRPPGAS
jgi:hypothetical protein